MLRFLKQQFWLGTSDRNIVMAVAGGFGLLFEVFTIVMTLVTRDPETIMLASGMTLVLGLFFVTLVFCGYFFVEFNMGLSMGATRRRMLAAGLFNSVCLECALFLVVAAMRLLEWAVYRFWLAKSIPGLAARVDFLGIMLSMPWWGKLLLVVVPVFLGFVSGTLIQRFGRAGFWVLWAAFMICFVLPTNALSWDLHLGSFEIAALIRGGCWVGGIGSAALAAWAAWLNLHASVRND